MDDCVPPRGSTYHYLKRSMPEGFNPSSSDSYRSEALVRGRHSAAKARRLDSLKLAGR